MLLDLLVLIFLIVTVLNIRVVMQKNAFNDDCLSLKSCNSYRGIFAFVVILHHISQRVSGGYLLSDFTRVGYLAVSVFFFLSGYGLLKKHLTDDNYSHGFLQKRLPAILIPYIIMTMIYWVSYAVLGDVKSIGFLWYDFIKNGNLIVWFSWYVVAIVLFYLAFYILMKTTKKNRPAIILGSVIYAILYTFICRKLSFGMWWYSTAFTPVAGLAFAAYEEKILAFLKRFYFFVLPVLMIAFYFIARFKWDIYWKMPGDITELILSTVLAILFLLLIVLFALKLKVGNKVLDFLGKISFELYMSQGLLMLVLRNDYIKIQNDFLYASIVLVLSVALAYVLNVLFSAILRKYKTILEKR